MSQWTSSFSLIGPTGPAASDSLAWNTFTPSWSSQNNPQPSLGNGVLAGRYKTIGKTTFVSVKLTISSTTTLGTDGWRISLPVDAYNNDAAILPTTFLQNGIQWLQGYSFTNYAGQTSTVSPVWDRGSNASSVVNSNTPFAWTSGDTITICGSYESI